MALRRLSTSSLTNPKWYRDGSAGLGPYTDFELIDETVLTTSAASVTFSNLGDYSTIYKHLQIRVTAKNTNTNWTYIRANGVSGTSYARHELRGNGTSVTSAASANYDSYLAGVTGTEWGGFVCDVLDAYSTNKNKTFRALSGWVGADGVQLTSGVFLSTNAISTLLISTQGGNFVAGSTFALFGIKGA